jgi:hypothetical protein
MIKKIPTSFRYLIFYLGVAALLIISTWHLNAIYSNYQNLKYLAVSNCIMHDRNTQICDPTNEVSSHFFRRVSLHSGDIIVSYLDDSAENRYQYLAFWKANCSPGTVIDLGRLEPLYMLGELECIDRSTFFEAEGAYVQMKLESIAKIDDFVSYGGFTASIEFSNTDYSTLEREVSIGFAKTPAEIAEEQRVVIETVRARLIEKEREEAAQAAQWAAQAAAAEQERTAAREELARCENRKMELISELKSQYVSQIIEDAEVGQCGGSSRFQNICDVDIWNMTEHSISSIQLGVVEFNINEEAKTSSCPTVWRPSDGPPTTFDFVILPNKKATLSVEISRGPPIPMMQCVVITSVEFLELDSAMERCGM